ncbi:hypothetical protein [Aliarcobacter butzleri]|uniref:hypothetical protein n=1 Tax=Aliarcobacter butzleri TaxID=28197 RepID=UPI0020942FB4|nr:hypothetical protein [Aliarcobacter butzleri]
MKKLLLMQLLFINLFATTLELDGMVESENEKVISSKMMGYITKINVNEGDKVKKVIFYMKLMLQIFHTMPIY